MMSNNDNITFFFEEKEKEGVINNSDEIEKMMKEFTNLQNESENERHEMGDFMGWMYNHDGFNMEYYLQKSNYGNDELFYEQEYTVKELLKICSYYEIDKNIKSSKCKKSDIIATIVYFESLPENSEIVKKRNRMWAYIRELLHDPKMKKFIIF